MKSFDFKGTDIFTGIDTHKRSWDLKMVTAHTSQKQLHMSNPSPEKVARYLREHFPGANYKCVYEAGMSGFWIQEELTKLGIDTIVVHPADVPTTDKEKRFKDDAVDCRKLALSLRSGQLTGIYIPPKQQQIDRGLVRLRYRCAIDERRQKHRITSHLDFYGIRIGEEEKNTYWSRNYIRELESHAAHHNDEVLSGLLDKLKSERQFVLRSTRQLRVLSKQERYAKSAELLQSIGGVGLLTAMVFLTEVGDVSRFKKDDHYVSYIGLVPGQRSSGENQHRGKISRRGNKKLRTAIILSAWTAIRTNPSMTVYYEKCKSMGMPGNKAIIKVARKLALVMKAVVRDQKRYESR